MIHRAVSRAAHPNGRRRAADTLARDRQSGDGSVGHRGDGRRTQARPSDRDVRIVAWLELHNRVRDCNRHSNLKKKPACAGLQLVLAVIPASLADASVWTSKSQRLNL